MGRHLLSERRARPAAGGRGGGQQPTGAARSQGCESVALASSHPSTFLGAIRKLFVSKSLIFLIA
jgi:hypothetical protein